MEDMQQEKRALESPKGVVKRQRTVATSQEEDEDQKEKSCSASVEQECSNEFTKVTPCLGYATGKAASPSDECCTAVKDIKSRDPVCLCYVIKQSHDGQASLKQMGIQEAKLVELPTACKLVNTSISDCPKLLKLSPNSADAAIFTNSSSAAETSNSTAGQIQDSKSTGFKHGTQIADTTVITVAVAIFISILTTELSTLLYAGA
ncbi:hypothetical protein NE237_021460 [Protea cynaroides]|uniref:Bifunctional inhibitor/plant lipid transfer protein/seed storage helical domain-containing protein n=1 Tax=Protea cynaroides TaxID=273540 RepID=A0A9Q0K4D6_9MAGN|nr:hypothetical protein NE237_021460 [Protea cynaroides]